MDERGLKLKKILIIDDNEMNRKFASEILKTEDFETIEAEDGTEGVYLAKKEVPNLILLDLAMPDVDGIEVCKRIREIEKLKDIPIVMLSAMGDKKLIELAKAAGADDYLVKPLNHKELVEGVNKFLA